MIKVVDDCIRSYTTKKIGEFRMKNGNKKEVLHLNETDNRKEVKRKFALWIKESTLDMVQNIYKEDNCSSRSEFIEKAIIFYVTDS